jgi:sec-independent protein translocase protein TatB
MLDLGLSKMALIGVVALVVLGPERLPRVARTAGALFGRAQRYINDVKSEVTREIELEELRRMKTDFESAAREVSSAAHNVENTIHRTVQAEQAELTEALHAGTTASQGAAGGALTDDATSAGALGAPSDGSQASPMSHAALVDNDRSFPFGNGGGNGNGGGVAATAKRRSWRAKRLATPLWYKRASLSRTHVQSGAARVARHTPATLRNPKRFL